MRIAVLANAGSPHTRRWAEAYHERGHEVHVVGIRTGEIAGAQVHTVGSGAPGRLASLVAYARLLLSVRRIIGRIAPDVVHAHYSVTHGAIAVLGRLRPVVLTVWGTDVVDGDHAVRGPKRWLNRWVLRRVAAVTGASRFLVDHVAAISGPRVTAHHVPFGVDTRRFTPPPIPPSEFVVGWVKQFRPRYDPWAMLTAFRDVAAEVPRARLVMAGSGALRSQVASRAREWGLRDQVDFVGTIPHHILPGLMHGFSVLANTSRSESFGVVLLEAGAATRPVVATNVGGVAEVVDDGVTGILVPKADTAALAAALIRLARDPSLAEAMGAAGRARVESEYEWAPCVDRMIAILEGAAS